MDDLIAFLRARLDEQERPARRLVELGMGEWTQVASVLTSTGNLRVIRTDFAGGNLCNRNMERHDPAYVLADVAAKRQIIAGHTRRECGCPDRRIYVGDWPCTTLRLLALPYAAHPDYDEDWEP